MGEDELTKKGERGNGKVKSKREEHEEEKD